LFLSSTETIWQVSDRYEAVNIDQGFVHRSRTHDRPAPRLAAVSAAPPAARRPRAKRSGTATRARTGTPPAGTPPAGTPPAETQPDHVEQAAVAARVGQEALDAGRGDAAVVEFRKWVCLAPDDVLAHLHLGIALEAVGDPASARRAYGTALRVLHAIEPARVESAIEGYAPGELLKFLRAKYEEHTP
jgi:hypothetical protein